jgi:general secretion pathway protein L
MRSVGIDIGSYSIKVAEVETHLKNVVIRRFFEQELSHTPGEDLRLQKIEILKSIAHEYDPSRYKIIVGLGSENSTQRILTFPFLERRKILQSLPFELEDVVPFSQSDAIFDCRVIRQKESSSNVLAFAVPKKYIQELLILCDDAGLSPDIVSLDGIALSNLFESEHAPVTETETSAGFLPAQLVIHIGYSHTLVNVLQNQKLLSSRAIYFGGKDLANAISRAYQLPYPEALKGVAEKSFILTSAEGADKDQIAFSQVMNEALKSLVVELRRTTLDIKAELKLEFTHGYLLGGMSGLINLGPYLMQQIGIPMTVYHHLGVTTKSDVSQSEQNEKASPVAVGLALEGLRKPRSPALNLRKNEFSKQSQRLTILLEKYRDIGKALLVLIIALFIYSYFRSSITESNLEAVDTTIKAQGKNPALALTSSQLKPENLKKVVKAKRDEIESKREAVKLNKTSSSLEILKSVSASLPPKSQVTLDIKSFNLEGDHLEIEGLVNSKAEADRVQRNISQLPSFTKILSNPAKIKAPGGKYAFNFSMQVLRLPSLERKGK